MFLEGCKCVDKKMPKYIIDNIDISSYSDDENSNEKKFSIESE